MSTTTTIRLPEELKARVERLAAASGGTVHAFMLEAIAEVADQSERRQAFHAEAERRWKKMLRTGEHLTHEDLRVYALALARGDKPARPPVRTMEPDELARLRARARRAQPK
ncbi:MAG: ribbon-helix-helix protein, CopG family [Rubrivivax sp.]